MKDDKFNNSLTFTPNYLKLENYREGELICFKNTKEIAIFKKYIGNDRTNFESFCSINGKNVLSKNKIFKTASIKGIIISSKEKEHFVHRLLRLDRECIGFIQYLK